MDTQKSRPGPEGQGITGSVRWIGLLAALSFLAGCSGDGDGRSPSPDPTYAISGTVTGASAVTVEIGGGLQWSTTTDASGRYVFRGLRNGTYTLTPILIPYEVSPAQRTVVVNGADLPNQDFTAVPVPVHALSGTVTGAASADVELAASIWTAHATTGLDGSFVFTGVPSGTYAISASAPGHALSPVRRTVTVAGADAIVPSYTAVALTSYDPLIAVTIDGARWMTPEFVRTISEGKARLSVSAHGMESNGVRGLTYTSALKAADGGGRVTTFQADVAVPAGATRTGAATVYGGLRLYYQPAADRGLAFPGALLNELIAALELYDSGSGLRLRRRFGHCDDAACTTIGSAGIAASDPAGFTSNGTSAWAPAAYDTTYTLALSLDEATGAFTWTVRGGAFDPEASGTVWVSSWADLVGMTLDSTTNGFLSAHLFARASDTSAAGGGSGSITVTFDNVMIGTNGGPATRYDDFSGAGSSEAWGFLRSRWRLDANGAVDASAEGVGVTAAVAEGSVPAQTVMAAAYPATFHAWQAELTVLPRGPGFHTAVLGGAFLNDGTAGAAHDRTGDVLCEFTFRGPGWTSTVAVLRCLDPACARSARLTQRNVYPTPTHPAEPGTYHSLFQQWDPVSRTFAARLDDGPPVFIPLAQMTAATSPRVPSRYVRAEVVVPVGAAAPGDPWPLPPLPAKTTALVRNVLTAP